MKARALSYGAVELKQMEHRYMALGLSLSVAIHAFVIAGYIFKGLVMHDVGPIHPPRPIPFPRIDWGDPTTVNPSLPPVDPYVRRGGAKHPGGRFAIPVPVPIPPANEDTVLFKAGASGPGAGLIDGDENGDGVVTSNGDGRAIEEEPPLPFTPVQKEPVIIKKVTPEYPELARRSGMEGKVWVKIWVDREGKAHKVELVKSTAEIFNEPSIAAARQFEFIPAYTNAGPVSVWLTVPFAFKIK